MIIYLHGFRSSPQSRKASMLRDAMTLRGRATEYACPALPASPREALTLAESLAGSVAVDELTLVGSSLGGYYATALAEKLGCRAALLNPAITPYADLAAHVGRQPVYFSQDVIDFQAKYLDELKAMQTRAITQPQRYFLIAATGDAVIDYRTMVAKYAGCRQQVIVGSDHEISDFASYIGQVLAFCGVE